MKVTRTTVNRYTFIAVICALIFFAMPDMAHAQDSTITKDIGEYVDMGIKLLSWIWVVPASIAGKLMTNDFTYGSIFHFDTYLRKLWTIMRTFAYFTLGFMFIVKLGAHFIKKDQAPSKLGVLFKNVVLAGILIPATRFIIAAVIDISIVATSAVAAFPVEILQNQRDSLKVTVTAQENHNVLSLNGDPTADSSKNKEVPLELKDILPSADNVGGPLVFMGAAILKLMDTNKIAENKGGSTVTSVKQLTIGSIIKIIALLMFIVPLVVLMVVNMIRVFRIWIWIIFSPFIVLDQVFKGPLQSNDKIGKNFKLSNILGLIFQPVAVVGLISVGLVLLIGVRDMLQGSNEYERGVLADKLSICISDNTSTFGCNTEIADVVVTGGFFEELGSTVGGFVGQTILLLFTVFLLRALVKAGFSMSEITNNVAKSMYKFAEDMIKTIPIPGTSLSWSSGGKAMDKLEQDNLGLKKKRREQSYAINNKIDRLFGIDTSSNLDTKERERLVNALDKGGSEKDVAKSFWKEAYTISQERPIKYNDSFKQILNDWFVRGNASKFLEKQNILTAAEAKEAPAVIMSNPKFLSFVDHTLTNGGTIVDGRIPNTNIITLEGKKYGKE